MEPDSCLHFTDEETGSERHTDFKEFVLKWKEKVAYIFIPISHYTPTDTLSSNQIIH